GLEGRNQREAVQADSPGHGIVEDSVRSADGGGGLAERVPGKAEPRRKVVQIGTDDGGTNTRISGVKQPGQAIGKSLRLPAGDERGKLPVLRTVHQERVPPE